MAKILHDSDCSTHNEPAAPKGPCDCGAELIPDALKSAPDMAMLTTPEFMAAYTKWFETVRPAAFRFCG